MYVHTYKPYFLKIYRICDLSKILEELSSQVKKNDIIEYDGFYCQYLRLIIA